MNDSLHIAATSLQAQQLNVDTVANNLANLNTSGFKKARVSFQDLMYREVARAAVGTPGADATKLGSGVSASTLRAFSAGELKKTDEPLDLAVRGEGFIEIVMPDGTTAYSRGGTLQVNRDGLLATLQGYALKPSIQVPPDATQLVIAPDGRVLARAANQRDALEVGRIELARFTNPGAMAPLGDNLYRATEASGEPRNGRASEDGAGSLAQGFLETSNVKLVEEMVELMVAQRAYEVSAKVIQASDEMMSLTNGLRR